MLRARTSQKILRTNIFVSQIASLKIDISVTLKYIFLELILREFISLRFTLHVFVCDSENYMEKLFSNSDNG